MHLLYILISGSYKKSNKQNAVATQQKSGPPLKRARGRPRTRQLANVQQDENANPGTHCGPVKRGRGRPRKTQVAKVTVEEDNEDDKTNGDTHYGGEAGHSSAASVNTAPMKCRGRPRKRRKSLDFYILYEQLVSNGQ